MVVPWLPSPSRLLFSLTYAPESQLRVTQDTKSPGEQNSPSTPVVPAIENTTVGDDGRGGTASVPGQESQVAQPAIADHPADESLLLSAGGFKDLTPASSNDRKGKRVLYEQSALFLSSKREPGSQEIQESGEEPGIPPPTKVRIRNPVSFTRY